MSGFPSLFSRRRFDLQNPSRAEWNVEMFRAIERALTQVPQTDPASLGQASKRTQSVHFCFFLFLCPFSAQSKCMSVPVVFLDSMLDQEVANRLATMITKHQVTQRELTGSVTKIHYLLL